jgi:hypothetical protein
MMTKRSRDEYRKKLNDKGKQQKQHKRLKKKEEDEKRKDEELRNLRRVEDVMNVKS